MALDATQLAQLAALRDEDLASQPALAGAHHVLGEDAWDILADIVTDECGAADITPETTLSELDVDDLVLYTIVTRFERDAHVAILDADADAALTVGDLFRAAQP